MEFFWIFQILSNAKCKFKTLDKIQTNAILTTPYEIQTNVM
jgi:hypothetical protein